MSLLIKNAQVVGAEKDLPERADVLVNGGLISAIGNFPGKTAEEVIDAQGAYLAPGFIDIDTTSDHYLSIFNNPSQEDFLKQGVTTIIGGQSGASLAPLLYGSLESIRKWTDPRAINIDWHTLAEFWNILSRKRLGVNFGTLLGHSTVRRALIGEEKRELTANEIKVFAGVLDRALSEGAFGMSTNLESIHARDTSYGELKELAKILEAKGRMYVGRDAAQGLKLQKETGVNALNLHFDENLDFLAQPIPGRVLPVYKLLPEWAQKDNLEKMQKDINDTWLSKRIQNDLPEFNPNLVTVETSSNEELIGESLQSFMEFSGFTDVKLALLNLMRAMHLKGVVAIAEDNSKELERNLLHPHALIGSHSAAKTPYWKETFGEKRAKRSILEYLSFMDKHGKFKDGLLKLTVAPAKKLGLKNRGKIVEGWPADLVILKPDNIRSVILNGKVVVADGNFKDVLNGTILKHA